MFGGVGRRALAAMCASAPLATAFASLSLAILGAGSAVAGGGSADGGGLTFLAIGDWGGENNAEPTTESQRATAVGMTRLARTVGANFTLLMGDNIYHHGIHEAAETTTRFRDTFEAVYARLVPGHQFYVMAGNHDYGQGTLANMSAQLEYSRLSPHWHFPSLWHQFRREFKVEGQQTRSLQIFVLDTVVLCGNGPENEGFIETQLRFVNGVSGQQAPIGDYRRSVAEKQWAWLEEGLESSEADFLWVTGHYPIWSLGDDGSTPCLIERLRPMLLRHGAHYISGHDHMLEHFQVGGLNSFVVGAGKECCYDPVNAYQEPPGGLRYMLAGLNGRLSQPAVPAPVLGGFASVRLGAETARVFLHADNGAVLYAAPPIARRRSLAPVSELGALPVLRDEPSFVSVPIASWMMLLLSGLAGALLGAAVVSQLVVLPLTSSRRGCGTPSSSTSSPLLATEAHGAVDEDTQPCGGSGQVAADH